ncbi:LysR family transcriptional regulator [Roseibium sp. RKSG952]|uniref:LysR family transcriptional regulator n=1 Tax=Roseibium sp. RKSG952 TaxID=2529384 RepID=UPI0012BB6B66|nr:LysR family transcriptional regulator [Roseibium sp. RKSG952]MTH96888.1 LysR family transcriptional regulator [Roseibium sp. RKSG952]
MPHTNLNDIQIFMAVVDAGSFVAGGKAMGLSRSAAGKAISRLESHFGTRLLNRSSRTLSLTDEGRVFHDHGLRILESVAAAETSLSGPKSVPRGVLRLTVPDAYGRRVILPIVEKYLGTWPDVQVGMSFSDSLANLVEDGFDLAIRIAVKPSDTRLISRVIARDKAVFCAAPSYLDRQGTPETSEGLSRHDCLFFESGQDRQGWQVKDKNGQTVRVTGRSRLRLDSAEALRQAALSGLGIALLPGFLVGEDLTAGRLIRLLPGIPLDDVPVLALYPEKRLLEPRVRRFIDLAVSELDR